MEGVKFKTITTALVEKSRVCMRSFFYILKHKYRQYVFICVYSILYFILLRHYIFSDYLISVTHIVALHHVSTKLR